MSFYLSWVRDEQFDTSYQWFYVISFIFMFHLDLSWETINFFRSKQTSTSITDLSWRNWSKSGESTTTQRVLSIKKSHCLSVSPTSKDQRYLLYPHPSQRFAWCCLRYDNWLSRAHAQRREGHTSRNISSTSPLSHSSLSHQWYSAEHRERIWYLAATEVGWKREIAHTILQDQIVLTWQYMYQKNFTLQESSLYHILGILPLFLLVLDPDILVYQVVSSGYCFDLGCSDKTWRSWSIRSRAETKTLCCFCCQGEGFIKKTLGD